MIAIGIIRRIWRYVVVELTIAGKIIFFAPLLLIITLFGIVAIIEFLLFDVMYVTADLMETRKINKKYGIEDSVWFLMRL